MGPAELSDADRERIIDVLREHFAAGQFEIAEFGRRAEALLGATTTDQAAAAVSDLPPLETVPQAVAKKPWWRRLVGGRYEQTDAVGAGWLPTTERFRDPSTGHLTRVWVDPADTSRHYVPENPAG